MQTNPANWLLLRGLTRESGHWGEFKEQMQLTFSQSSVFTLDLPGTGIYCHERSPSSVAEITAQVRKHAVENGWLKTPVNLLAVSLGGMVALDWLQTCPEEINAGVVINISLAGFNPFYHRLRWQSYLDLLRIIRKPNVYERELEILKLISNRSDNYEILAKDWYSIQREHPVSGKNAINQLFAAARYRPRAEKPSRPVLLLNSLGDRLVHPCCTNKINQHWHYPCKTHPTAGHDLTTDDGDWVIEQIQDWLQILKN